MPTLEHFPIPKRDGGRKAVDNAILAHRLCNRIDYSLTVGRSHASDLERVRKAREEATRRSNERPQSAVKFAHVQRPAARRGAFGFRVAVRRIAAKKRSRSLTTTRASKSHAFTANRDSFALPRITLREPMAGLGS
jgi:hypothetical protein